MKYLIIIIVFFVGSVDFYCQDLNNLPHSSLDLNTFKSDENSNQIPYWSTIALAGSSHTVKTPKGVYYVSQSIGQSAVIGTKKKGNYTLLQGYQHSSKSMKIVANNDSTLKATVYPNPFEQSINVLFDSVLKKDISIYIFDVTGRTIFSQKYPPSQILNIPVNYISAGLYVIKIYSQNKQFTANLIKK